MKILQMSTYNVDQLDHGGKLRAYHIRQALRKSFDVQTLSFEWADRFDADTTSVSLDSDRWSALGLDGYISDWGVCSYFNDSDLSFKKVCKLVHGYAPDAIILEQPFLWPLLERLIYEKILDKRIKFIYSSHNIEFLLKKNIYYSNYEPECAKIYLEHVRKIEISAIKRSALTIAVSATDKNYIKEISPEVPVCIYLNGHSRVEQTVADVKWRDLFAGYERNWIFVGSWHPPNINGLRDLVTELAGIQGRLNSIALWVLGSAGNGLAATPGFRRENYPWLHILGPVSGDDVNSAILASSGVVLPIWEGGGSNLKTAQALLSGKSILGTELSFRSFEEFAAEPGVQLASDAHGLAHLIAGTIPQTHYARSNNVFSLTWERILESLPEIVNQTLFERPEEC